MKTALKLIVLTTLILAISCIDNPELEPPQMQLSFTDTESILFSWREPAIVKVSLKSDEDIERFTMTSEPSYWQLDTTFPQFTHQANFDIKFTLGRGFVVKDSVAIVRFKAFSNGLCNEQFRKFKYKFNYPAIDSFDIEMCADPISGKCLLDIAEKSVYKYSEYVNHNFDLVLVYEQRKLWRQFGLALVSPDSEYYLSNYFLDKLPELPYTSDYTNLTLRTTETGMVARDKFLTWDNLTPELLDSDNDFFIRYLDEDENYGLGISNLQPQNFYKIKMYNGKKAMLRITNITYGTSYPTINMTVYYQKD